jgi:hypothetical protein
MSRLVAFESKVFRVILGGVPLEDGRSDPFFKITPRGDAYVTEGPGADGHYAICGTNDDGYDIELSFKGTSSCNEVLSAMHIADRKAFNGAGILPLLVQDESGSTLIQTDQCRIMSMAEQTVGVTKGDVNWKLFAKIAPGSFVLGGN